MAIFNSKVLVYQRVNVVLRCTPTNGSILLVLGEIGLARVCHIIGARLCGMFSLSWMIKNDRYLWGRNHYIITKKLERWNFRAQDHLHIYIYMHDMYIYIYTYIHTHIYIYIYTHTYIYIHIQIAFLQIIYLFSQVPGCVHYHPELPIDTHNYMCITIYYHPFLYIITHDCPVKTILMIHLYSDVLPWGEQTWPENKPFIDDSQF